jgi:GNAT superfamily N-acetyltransferase
MSMVTFTVREAELGDAWEIARVHVRAWQAAYRGIVPDERLDAMTVSHRAQRWEEWLRHGLAGMFTYVAEAEGELHGFCTVRDVEDQADLDGPGREIVSVYVDPGSLRRGVGTALLYRSLDRLRDEGWTDVRLWVFAANRTARAFYARHGFETDGSTQIRIAAVPEVRMWRSLDGPNDPQSGRMASSQAPSETQE